MKKAKPMGLVELHCGCAIMNLFVIRYKNGETKHIGLDTLPIIIIKDLKYKLTYDINEILNIVEDKQNILTEYVYPFNPHP